TSTSGSPLQVGNGAATGNLGTGSVTDNAALSSLSLHDALPICLISGTGNLSQTGTGTISLSGANTYSGTTTINAGSTLSVGAGDTASAHVSTAVTYNARMPTNPTDKVTIASAISGTGTLTNTAA